MDPRSVGTTARWFQEVEDSRWFHVLASGVRDQDPDVLLEVAKPVGQGDREELLCSVGRAPTLERDLGDLPGTVGPGRVSCPAGASGVGQKRGFKAPGARARAANQSIKIRQKLAFSP